MAIFVLLVMWTAVDRPASFTQEFTTKAKCEAAAAIVRQSRASVILATCTEK